MKRETILITIAAMLAFDLTVPLREAEEMDHSAKGDPKTKKSRRRRKRKNTLSEVTGLKTHFETLSHPE